MSLITTIIDGIAPNPSSGLGGANEGHIQGFQDDIINGIAGGVADKTGGQCLVTQNSPLGMSVLVADGVVYIPNADYIANLATATKFYRVVIKDEDPVTIPSNTSGSDCQHGLDVVVNKVTVPNEYGSNIATLVVTLGTPGAGAPAVPDNGYRLAEVEVVDGATQIATASITDTRTQISINDVVISTNIVTKTGTQTLTNKTLTSPKVGTAILDTNGNEVIKTPATPSAVNEVTLTNAATGNSPSVSATGGDDNLDLLLVAKGTGVVKANGVAVATGTVPVKASGAEVTTGTDDAKFATAKALADAGVNTRLKSKIITATRDMTGADGDVAYTGVGFQPTAVFALAAINGTIQYSIGAADSSATEINLYNAQASTNVSADNTFLVIWAAGGGAQTGALKQFDADGFTITWTKYLTPTGTVTMKFLCFR